MFTDEQIKQLAKVIDAKLDEKLKPIKESQERIEKKLDREVTDLAENVREIMIKLDKLDDHETRIKQLEDPEVLPRSH